MHLESAILGTLDFLWQEVILTFVGSNARSAGRKTALPVVIPAQIALEDLLVMRLLRNKRPLSARATHVPSETRFTELKDSGPINDIEYVIQEHIADRAHRHFDLRLVVNGRAVSWAIPMEGKRALLARMPLPKEQWLAIRQPDHSVAYNKFEGTIPQGQYGAGTVKIWAAGKADILKIEDKHVHFKIYDGPAKGEYILVHTLGKQGLLIAKSPEVVDLWSKPGYTKKPEEILDEAEARGFLAENKIDGAAVELRLGEAYNAVLSHRVSRRTGSLVSHSDRLPAIRDRAVANLAGTRLRAEAWHPNGVNFLAGTLNSGVLRAREVQREHGPVQLGVFDITHYQGKSVVSLPYSERRALYEQVCKDLGLKTVRPIQQVKHDLEDFYSARVADRRTPSDGIILKKPEWAFDEKPWPKVKPSDTADCVILDITEGAGGNKAGALIVRCNTDIVHVGTGFTDWEREWIWEHRKDLVGDVVRADFHVRHGKITNTGPRFTGWHPDKSDVGLQMYADVMKVHPYALKYASGWRPA